MPKSNNLIHVLPTGKSAGQGDKTAIFSVEQDPSNTYQVDAINYSGTVTIKDDGPPPGALSLASIVPNKGGDGGVVTATVYGTNIKSGAIVKLSRSGQADILGTNAIVSANGTFVTATFDLTSKRKACGMS